MTPIKTPEQIEEPQSNAVPRGEYKSVPAETLRVGDVIHYNELDVTVIEPKEPSPNQFGLPWFRYRVECELGWGFAQFGPGGSALKKTEGATA